MRESIRLLLVARSADDTESTLRYESLRVAPRIGLVAPDGTVYKVDVIGTGVSVRGVEALVIPVQPIWKMPLLMLGVCGLITWGLSFASTPTAWGVLLSWLLPPVLILVSKWLGRWLELRYLRRIFRQERAKADLKEAEAEGKIAHLPGPKVASG